MSRMPRFMRPPPQGDATHGGPPANDLLGSDTLPPPLAVQQELYAMRACYEQVQGLDADARERVIRWLATTLMTQEPS